MGLKKKPKLLDHPCLDFGQLDKKTPHMSLANFLSFMGESHPKCNFRHLIKKKKSLDMAVAREPIYYFVLFCFFKFSFLKTFYKSIIFYYFYFSKNWLYIIPNFR